MNLTPKELIDAVRSNVDSRNRVIESFYLDTGLRAKIANYILKNKGDNNDVESCLVDAIMAFIKRCYRKEFILTSTAEAYVFSIARNLWIAKAKQKNQFVQIKLDADVPSFESQLISDERKALLQLAINKLEVKCQEILLSWAQNMKMREIAIRMEYKSDGMARKKKFECMQKLKALFSENKN